MKSVAFHTLGCKVNQVETDKIRNEFLKKGYLVKNFDEYADVYVINTCTVTHISDRKSRAMIRRAIRNNPQAIIVATGCIAQTDSVQLAQIEGLTLVVGNRDKGNIVNIIEDWEAQDGEQQLKIIVQPITANDKPKAVHYMQHMQRSRAFVKVQDGCQSFCSYCIVPYARGPVRSKLPEDVLNEVQQLLGLGYREIVLTGIHTGMYGLDLEKWNLHKLLLMLLDKAEGDYRIRLSSLEPLEISAEIIKLAAGEEKLCRHFHIPLQSGSNKILTAMNRRYKREYYRDMVQKIARNIPGIAIAADIMVGFPGEEAEDFQDSYELLEALPICDLHVFKYSKRPGTPAALLQPEVSEQEKKSRSDKLLRLAKIKQDSFLKDSYGNELKVVVERQTGDRRYVGTSDNYINVEFEASSNMVGSFISVVIRGSENGIAQGSILNGLTNP
ncbi:MAG: tRNA (N(6)-L-threonylcarbamoyladenosine(37)-C(2))-methylthiotransferase MtaB [Syntrophomonadaceae bacterium]|nr:tRNA (N(6)-L-threonylcarbamoyladenosine(37)-C(2))-methylthiotransferase MtaB [Syntrophomonadaceae bacterium]MDD3022776.1 tRNA (N(6)-L-threonylcarbamoyladenosine(37)-C(2))-methylthiotransferase MtaB [Syntrophomonadaceae bacterium]